MKAMKTEKPLLTISLLISNRPDTVPRCLDSLRLIMDEIPSELILIDTSKSDEIHELLLTYTDYVYKFDWCNDFAKARNEGVKRAKGKWFLYLDDDEWFVDAEKIVDFFKSGQYKNYGSANIQLRNFLNPEYTEYSDTWVTRLFKLEEDVMFWGRIHEYMLHYDDRQIFLESLANHSGYIFNTPEKRQKHYERNSKILLELVEEEPDNLRWQGQMVQEYRMVKDWESMVKFCEKHLAQKKTFINFMDQNHFCTLYAGLVHGLTRLERAKEAVIVCDKAVKDSRSTDMLKAFMFLHKAENSVQLEEWQTARDAIEKYLEYYRNFDPNNTEMRQQTGALLIQDAFDTDYVDTANNIWVYTGAKLGDKECISIWEEKQRIEQEIKELSEMKTRIIIGPGVQVYEYYDLLKDYAKKELEFYQSIHEENDNEELPMDIKAAIKINEYIEMELQDKVQALAKLKEVVDICPQFSLGIGKFFHLYSEFEKQREMRHKEEMKQLRNQVLEQVKTMQLGNQMKEALSIVGQLKQMFPDDLEVAQLALECRIKTI